MWSNKNRTPNGPDDMQSSIEDPSISTHTFYLFSDFERDRFAFAGTYWRFHCILTLTLHSFQEAGAFPSQMTHSPNAAQHSKHRATQREARPSPYL